MSSDSHLERLVSLWKEYGTAPEELCKDNPELLSMLLSRIREFSDSDSDSVQEHARHGHPVTKQTSPADGSEPVGFDFPDSQATTIGVESHQGSRASTAERGPGAAAERFPTAKSPIADRYELMREIGRGGFGRVWLACDRELDREVAVKLVHIDECGPQTPDEALREARNAAKLRHPRIASVHDVGRDGDYLYIVTDYIEGSSLAEMLDGRRLEPLEAIRLTRDVAEALHHAHVNDVVHRDVKPSNIVVGTDGSAYLVDFGLAAGEEDQLDEMPTVLGTYGFMAPELALGRSHTADARADVWSLGVLLYLMLTGRLPFKGRTPSEYTRQLLEREPRPPRTIVDTIPAELEAICLRCLRKEPAERFSTAKDVATALRQCEKRLSAAGKPHFKRGFVWGSAILGSVLLLAVLALSFPNWLPGSGTEIGQPSPSSDSLQPTSDTIAVLAREPKKIAWAEGLDDTYYRWDKEKQSLVVSCANGGMLQLGEIPRPDFRLSMEVEQLEWTGDFGLFLGYHVERRPGKNPVHRYQQITFQRFTINGRRNYAWFRVLAFADLLSPMHANTGMLSRADVVEPRGAQTLEFTVRKSRLTEFRWNGISLDRMPNPRITYLTEEDFTGPYGVLVFRGTVTFRNMYLTLLPKEK